MDKIFLIIVGLLSFCIFGCSQEKTFLSDELRNVNPYRVGQVMVFISNVSKEDTLTITKVEDGRFPDAIGAPLNEHLVVNAFRRSRTVRHGTDERILTILAKTNKQEEQIDFSISLKETSLIMKTINFSEYQSRATFNFSTRFNSYDDILHFENYPSRRTDDREIVEFYWSKSIGYIRLVQKDGTVWDLRSIE